MTAGLDVLESLAPTRVDVDDTDRFRFARVLWAVLALFPWGMNLANEIEAGIVLARSSIVFSPSQMPKSLPAMVCSFRGREERANPESRSSRNAWPWIPGKKGLRPPA